MNRTNSNSSIVTVGIEIGKNTFHVIGLDGDGNIVLRRKLSRSQIVARFVVCGVR